MRFAQFKAEVIELIRLALLHSNPHPSTNAKIDLKLDKIKDTDTADLLPNWHIIRGWIIA